LFRRPLTRLLTIANLVRLRPTAFYVSRAAINSRPAIARGVEESGRSRAQSNQNIALTPAFPSISGIRRPNCASIGELYRPHLFSHRKGNVGIRETGITVAGQDCDRAQALANLFGSVEQ
jgi:hypothetical protein